MLLFGDEREVQQGEAWNLDILISQSSIEYVPFIVSSKRVNPMLAITVASTKYEKNERYVATWWQDLSNGEGFGDNTNPIPLPRFYQTVPADLGIIAAGQPLTRPANLDTEDGFDPPMYALYRYMKAEDTVDVALGHRPYYYVYFAEEDPNTPRHDYDFRVRMQFESTETAEWGSQNYMYQITLVDTVPMAEYIDLAHEAYPNLQWMKWVTQDDPRWIKPVQNPGESSEEYNARVEASWKTFKYNWISDNVNVLFPFIKNRIPTWFQPDIDIDAPVGYIDIPQVILAPTKLQVNNNLRRII